MTGADTLANSVKVTGGISKFGIPSGSLALTHHPVYQTITKVGEDQMIADMRKKKNQFVQKSGHFLG